MSTPHAVTTMATDRVNLIDKDQTRSMLLALLEHVAHPAGTNAHKHFHKVRSTNREEWHIRLTCNSTGKEGLTCSWRAYHEDALGNGSTECLKLAWIAKKIDNLKELLFGFLDAGDIFEGNLLLIHREHLGLGLTKAHCSLAGRLHLMAEEEKDQCDQKKNGKETQHHLAEGIILSAGLDVGTHESSRMISHHDAIQIHHEVFHSHFFQLFPAIGHGTSGGGKDDRFLRFGLTINLKCLILSQDEFVLGKQRPKL